MVLTDTPWLCDAYMVKFIHHDTNINPEVCETVRSESCDWRESMTSLCVEEADRGVLIGGLVVMFFRGRISLVMSTSSMTSVGREEQYSN